MKTSAERASNRKYMKEYSKRPEVVARVREYRIAYRERKRIKDAVYYQNNRQGLLDKAKRYRDKLPKKVRLVYTEAERKVARNRHVRKQYWTKREVYLGYAKRYAERHPERIKERNRLRRARERKVIGHHTEAQWKDKLAFYGYSCYYCKCYLTHPTRDHAIPIARGGTDWISNILPACRSCNSRKRTRTIFEWTR